jgi:hypothetical protein
MNKRRVNTIPEFHHTGQCKKEQIQSHEGFSRKSGRRGCRAVDINRNSPGASIEHSSESQRETEKESTNVRYGQKQTSSLPIGMSA